MNDANCPRNQHVFEIKSAGMTKSYLRTRFAYLRGTDELGLKRCCGKCFATFPLVVRKELQMGVVATVWLAWWQMVPVLLTSVGILVTVARTWILERGRDAGNKWGLQGIQQCDLMADMFNLTDDTVSVCFMTSGVSCLEIQRFPNIWFIWRSWQSNVLVAKMVIKRQWKV